MQLISWSRLWTVVAAAGVLALMGIAGAAVSSAQEEPEERREIKLRFATFDPVLDGEPEVPHTLEAPDDADAYLVQFTSAPTDEARDELADLGVQVAHYVPDHAHVVRMDADTRELVEDLEVVRWVGAYHPAFKLEPVLVERLEPEPPVIESADDNDERRYSLMTLQRGDADHQAVADHITRVHDGEVHHTSDGGFRMEATLTEDALRDVVAMGEILFIDRWFPPEPDMDLVRDIDGADDLEAVAGYTGEGVRGEVMDSRLRTTHQDFQGTEPIIHGDNEQPDEDCSGNGHGTCSYGVVFGDGAGDPDARGLLPDAQGIFAQWFPDDRDAHTARLVDPDGDYRAVFQSNSWGSGRTTDYTTVSADMDDLVMSHDLLITQSQSNAGNQDSRPQAWAKNVVSVGGIRHHRSLDPDDHEWDGASIGPAADGRIKPDLSHFYHRTHTTGATGDDVYQDYGGTSLATPITAGHFGLLFEMWADGVFDGGPGADRDVFDARPGAATAKAMMINAAKDYDFDGDDHNLARVHQGWGRSNVDVLYELARHHEWELPVLVDESDPLAHDESHEHTVAIDAPGCWLRATMVYTDPMGNPAATEHRVNDLSLRLTAPDGTEYWGNNGLAEGNWSTPGGEPNSIDTVQNVWLADPEQGEWTVEVIGHEIVEDANPDSSATEVPYALVVTPCAEADAEIVEFDVDPPADVTVEEDSEPLEVHTEVTNHGPAGADFELTLRLDLPDDCSVPFIDEISESLTLEPGETDAVDTEFFVGCDEPGDHSFEVSAEVVPTEPPYVADPNPDAARASTEVTVAAIDRIEAAVPAVGTDVDGLRAVAAPAEPGEPGDGLGPLAAPWDDAGDRPLPWADTDELAIGIGACDDLDGHRPQPGHDNWSNPRSPITLVAGDADAVSLVIDALVCAADDVAVDVDTTVTATVTDGDCHFDGGDAASVTRSGTLDSGWNLGNEPVALPDDVTMDEAACSLTVDVDHEATDDHHELVGAPQASIDVDLIAAVDGRMTGGGHVDGDDGQRVSHALQLRCDGSGPATVQVTGGDQRFHLESLDAVLCFDDPDVDSRNGVDHGTIVGVGEGRLDGESGVAVTFRFVDAGEPGVGVDSAEIAVGGGPESEGLLDGGNIQAHPPRGGGEGQGGQGGGPGAGAGGPSH